MLPALIQAPPRWHPPKLLWKCVSWLTLPFCNGPTNSLSQGFCVRHGSAVNMNPWALEKSYIRTCTLQISWPAVMLTPELIELLGGNNKCQFKSWCGESLNDQLMMWWCPCPFPGDLPSMSVLWAFCAFECSVRPASFNKAMYHFTATCMFLLKPKEQKHWFSKLPQSWFEWSQYGLCLFSVAALYSSASILVVVTTSNSV